MVYFWYLAFLIKILNTEISKEAELMIALTYVRTSCSEGKKVYKKTIILNYNLIIISDELKLYIQL